jgi:hypothetical protein
MRRFEPFLSVRVPLACAAAAAFAVLVPRPAWAALAVPPPVSSGGHASDPLVKAGYLDATLYGADPTGKTDSTAAIQNAIDDAMQYDMTTYLPAGTYLVSDTLNGKASGQVDGCLTHTSIGTPNAVPQSPSLVGPGSGPRPQIVLANGASGFADATSPRPVLHFWDYVASCPSGEQCNGWQGQADCLMWAVIRDVDLSLGTGNPGAVGIQFAAAQYSYIENVSVDATGGYAGLQGVPSTEVVVNVAVTGGQYGIIPTTCCGISLVGVTLKDQQVAALWLDNFAATMVAGFDIEETTGSAVLNTFFTSQTSQIALLDGNINLGSSTSPAIDNSLGHDLYVGNVYVEASGALVRNGSGSTLGASGHDHLSEYSFTNTQSYTQSGETQTSMGVVDGAATTAPIANVQAGSAAPPSDLVLRHLPGPLPWFEDPGVVDVTTLGADPTGTADSTVAIQKAIDQSEYVFLPRGDYLISATLTLQPDTHLFGVPGMRSRIFGTTWNPQGQYQPFIRTADTATGATHVGDLWLQMPGSYDSTFLSALDWRAGRSSINRQVATYLPWGTDPNTEPRKLVHVEGNGGGRWYGLQLSLEESRSYDPGGQYRSLLVEGTTAPLTLYGPNPEHAQTEPEFEFSGVKNVRVLGIKTEASLTASIEDSDNVMFAAHAGHDSVGSGGASLRVSGSTNVLLPVDEMFSGNAGQSPQGFNVQEMADGGTSRGVPANDQCSLFARGSFDESPFPYCGDGVCDGAETATNCAVDCSASSVPADGGPSSSGDAGPSGTSDAGATAPASGDAGPGNGDAPAGQPTSSNGCACSVVAPYDDASSCRLALAGLAVLVTRRRSRALAGPGRARAS